MNHQQYLRQPSPAIRRCERGDVPGMVYGDGVSGVWPVIVGIAVMVVGISLSVGLHELGHMLPAKKFGVRVPRYMVGFGPTLWSRRKGETEYGIKAIPLGGFVTLVGALPPEPKSWKRKNNFFNRVVSDARDESQAEVLPGEEHRAFYRLSAPKKVIVMAAGTWLNLLLAVLMIAGAFAIGLEQPTTVIASVDRCLPQGSADPQALAPGPGEGDACELSPAYVAGLQPGDSVTAIDGVAVSNWNDVLTAVQDSTAPLEFTVARGSELVTAEVTPVTVVRTVVDDAGNPVRQADGSLVVVEGPMIGIGPTFARQSIPMSQLPGASWDMFSGTVSLIATFPVQVYRVASDMFSDSPRDTAGVMSVVGVGRVAVEVAGADAGVLDRVAVMLSLVGSLNMAMFVFNLLPLLPLDGGHVANAIYEGTKRTWARKRGRPDPGPADVARMLPVAYVMTFVLFASMLLLVLADVVDPISMFR